MKKTKFYKGNFACLTDIGKVRVNNEDQAFAVANAKGNVLLIVADGMGGQNKGELASSIAINTIKNSFLEHNSFFNYWFARAWLNKALIDANEAVYKEANNNPRYQGMGTTLSAALIYKNLLITANVGDSRVYKLNNDKLEQLSEDQSYVAYLYRTGQITKEEMATHPKRSILMNALGIYPTLNVDFHTHKYNGETLLLCSDGLYNNANEKTILSVLMNDDDVADKSKELIAVANANGGSDNIAVAIWESKNAD